MYKFTNSNKLVSSSVNYNLIFDNVQIQREKKFVSAFRPSQPPNDHLDRLRQTRRPNCHFELPIDSKLCYPPRNHHSAQSCAWPCRQSGRRKRRRRRREEGGRGRGRSACSIGLSWQKGISFTFYFTWVDNEVFSICPYLPFFLSQSLNLISRWFLLLILVGRKRKVNKTKDNCWFS